MNGTHAYPEWFQASARAAWAAQARQRLSSVHRSRTGLQEPSAEAARSWLMRQGCRPFLNEVALRSLVFAAPGVNRSGEAAKAVDWVAEAAGGALFLLEAKSALDSAAIGQCMDGRDKFTATLEAPATLARIGGRAMPATAGLVITARSVAISGHSSWRVAEDGGPLLRGGAPQLVAGAPVRVVILSF